VDLDQQLVVAFQISSFIIVFGYGLRAEFGDLRYLLGHPVLLLRSFFAVMVVMPAVAVLLARWFDVAVTVEIALVALAISPLPPLLPIRESKAGGGQDFGLGLMIVLAATSIVLVPLAVRLIGASFGRTYVTAPATIAVVTSTSILLPILSGMVTRACAPKFTATVAERVNRVGVVFLPVAAAVLFAAAAPDVWRLVGDGTLLVVAAFVVTGFAVGHLFGRPELEHSAVLAFSAACRHPGTALAVAAMNYPDHDLKAAVLIYLAVNVVVGLLYAYWLRARLRRRGPGPAPRGVDPPAPGDAESARRPRGWS
jgi:bile acid:Na+ symporter, BASS family